MTNEQVLALYTAMESEFGELPDFEHYPQQFLFYYKLFRLIQSTKN
jgi:hypothetical protein